MLTDLFNIAVLYNYVGTIAATATVAMAGYTAYKLAQDPQRENHVKSLKREAKAILDNLPEKSIIQSPLSILQTSDRVFIRFGDDPRYHNERFTITPLNLTLLNDRYKWVRIQQELFAFSKLENNPTNTETLYDSIKSIACGETKLPEHADDPHFGAYLLARDTNHIFAWNNVPGLWREKFASEADEALSLMHQALEHSPGAEKQLSGQCHFTVQTALYSFTKPLSRREQDKLQQLGMPDLRRSPDGRQFAPSEVINMMEQVTQALVEESLEIYAKEEFLREAFIARPVYA